MTLDTKSHREQIAFRARQAGDDDLSYGVRLMAVATLMALGNNLCDALDAMRAERDDWRAAVSNLAAHNLNLSAERDAFAARLAALESEAPQ